MDCLCVVGELEVGEALKWKERGSATSPPTELPFKALQVLTRIVLHYEYIFYNNQHFIYYIFELLHISNIT